MYAIVRASVRACSKLALGWRSTAARQTSPSMSSPRGLASTRWRTTGASSACRSRISLSLLIRRSSMATPLELNLGGEDGRPNHLRRAVERLADPHGCDGLVGGFIQVLGGPLEGAGHLGLPGLGGEHQRLDRVGGFLGGSAVEPAPGAVRALALEEPGEGRLAEVRCRREEREDGVGGGIEGGTMPLVDPVVAVYARVAQVLDDLLLDDVLAWEGADGAQHLEDVGIGGDGRVALEREGEEVVDALEGPKRTRGDRIAVLVKDGERQGGVVGVGAESFFRHPDAIIGKGLGQIANQRLRLFRPLIGARQVVKHPRDLEDLERLDRRQAAVTAVAQQPREIFIGPLVARLCQEKGRRGG